MSEEGLLAKARAERALRRVRRTGSGGTPWWEQATAGISDDEILEIGPPAPPEPMRPRGLMPILGMTPARCRKVMLWECVAAGVALVITGLIFGIEHLVWWVQSLPPGPSTPPVVNPMPAVGVMSNVLTVGVIVVAVTVGVMQVLNGLHRHSLPKVMTGFAFLFFIPLAMLLAPALAGSM